jgi:hypothetical protein
LPPRTTSRWPSARSFQARRIQAAGKRPSLFLPPVSPPGPTMRFTPRRKRTLL